MKASLPENARLPINRCNLPSVILGSLSFQQHPTSLLIDGVQVLHKKLFKALDEIQMHEKRSEYFIDYMTVHFRLHKPEDAGFIPGDTNKRISADYLRMLRGWLFDPNGKEAAVLKGWVESRFGLLTRYHKQLFTGYSDISYQLFLSDKSQGLYGTNALESQFDLLYSYCQYELSLLYKEEQTLTLYRGVNSVNSYETLMSESKNEMIILFNNLNSFSRDRERACEFGDYILEVETPWQKVLFYSNLLPGIFIGEEEYIVLGGIYKVSITG